MTRPSNFSLPLPKKGFDSPKPQNPKTPKPHLCEKIDENLNNNKSIIISSNWNTFVIKIANWNKGYWFSWSISLIIIENFRCIIIAFRIIIELKCGIKYLTNLVDTFGKDISIIEWFNFIRKLKSFELRLRWVHGRLICFYYFAQCWCCILT